MIPAARPSCPSSVGARKRPKSPSLWDLSEVSQLSVPFLNFLKSAFKGRCRLPRFLSTRAVGLRRTSWTPRTNISLIAICTPLDWDSVQPISEGYVGDQCADAQDRLATSLFQIAVTHQVSVLLAAPNQRIAR